MNVHIERLITKTNEMANTVVEAAPRIAIGVTIFIVFIIASRFVKKSFFSILSRNREHANLAHVLSRLSSVLIVVIGFLVASGVIFPSVTPADLLGLLGIGGVAIGFAFKDIFQNFLAGILILVLRTFKIGDQIEVDGIEGTVEDIEIRATIIKTYDNRRVIIPNADIFSSKVIINTAYDKRRISAIIGIGFGDDIVKAKQVILEAVNKIEGILQEPPPYVLVTNYGGSSVDLELRFWLTPPRRRDVLDMTDAVLEVLKPALFGAGIDIPFPTQQILFHDQTESTDGHRKSQREGWPTAGNDPGPREFKIPGSSSGTVGTRGESETSSAGVQ